MAMHMSRRARVAVAAWVLGALAAPLGWAMYPYTPLAGRLAEADLVVVGSIGKLGDVVEVNGGHWDTGVIRVTDVLKGDRRTKQVTLAWPQLPKGIPVGDGPPAYQVGVDGVWILRKRADRDVYTATYPPDRQPMVRRAEVVALLDRLAKLQWGEAVDGLSLAVLVNHQSMKGSVIRVRGKRVDVEERLEAIVFARNGGQGTARLLDYHPDQPVTLRVLDPDGQPVQVALYPRYAKGQEPELTTHYLKTVPPGATIVLKHCWLPFSAKTGVFKVTASYENRRDAKALKVAVWKGKIEAPARHEKVPLDAAGL